MLDITVVIATRNRPGMLRQALQSVLRQRDVDLEIVVVDDGSTVDLSSLVNQLHDPRVTLLRNERPQGSSAARNRGIAAAEGKWIAPMDDDDMWAPNKLAHQLEAVQRSECDWVYGGAVVVQGDGSGFRIVATRRPLAAERMQQVIVWRNAMPGGGSNIMFRAGAFGEGPVYDPGLARAQDWDLTIRLALGGLPAVVDHPLLAYRLHRGNQSLDTTETIRCLKIIEDRYSDKREGRPINWAGINKWFGFGSLRTGHRWEATKAYARAGRAGDPRSLRRAAVALLHPDARALALDRMGIDKAWAEPVHEWLNTLD